MTKRAIVLVVFTAVTATAQAPMPIDHIDIDAARNQLSKVAAADRAITCDDKSLGQHQEMNVYCNLVGNLLFPTTVPVLFSIYATQDKSLLSGFISEVANSNLGTQLGSSSASPGTATVAERAGYSSVLGLALETGAVTQSVSGSTLNLQANSLSLYRFLANQDVFQYCPDGTMSCQGSLAEVLNRISESATISVSGVSNQNVSGTVPGATTSNTSASTASASTTLTSTPPSATALIQNGASRLSSLTLHIQLWSSLDLRSQSYINAWKTAVGSSSVTSAAKTAEQGTKALDWFDPSKQNYGDWLKGAEAAVRSAIESNKNDAEISDVIHKQWDDLLPIAQKDSSYSASGIQQFLQNAKLYLAARDAAVNTARQQTQSGLSLEYTYSQLANQPHLSTLRLAYTLHPGLISSDAKTSSSKTPAANSASQAGGGKAGAGAPAKTAASAPTTKPTNDFAITFNAAADLYDSPPAGTSAFRDLQGALQLDKHFGNTIGTLAAYYQYQHSASAINIGQGNLAPNTNIVLPSSAATLLAPKGNMVVAQAKLTFALKNGASVPVGVTWSNRTELIKASEVRGHVGIDFDWSSLFASKSSQ